MAPDTTASVREAIAPPIASAEQVEATSGVKVMRGNGGPPKALIIDVARASLLNSKSPPSGLEDLFRAPLPGLPPRAPRSPRQKAQIDAGEQPLEAAKRELWEETNVSSIELIAELPEWLKYDLPEGTPRAVERPISRADPEVVSVPVCRLG